MAQFLKRQPLWRVIAAALLVPAAAIAIMFVCGVFVGSEPAHARPCCSYCETLFMQCINYCDSQCGSDQNCLDDCYSSCEDQEHNCFVNCVMCSGGGSGSLRGCPYEEGWYCPPYCDYCY